MKLFHLSTDPEITRFEPRQSQYTTMPVVWAVSEAGIANYLLPRDCPRVCFRAGPDTTAMDVARFLGPDQAVIAIEAAWLAELQQSALCRYVMPAKGFRLQDKTAGYWVSEAAVVPLGMDWLTDLPSAIAGTGVALRVSESLWPLHDGVAASSLAFSMIRMRNAQPR